MAIIIALALMGIILIFVEVFMPGGVLGGLGVVCLVASMAISFVKYEAAGLAISAVVVVSCSVASYIVALKILPRTSLGRGLFLKETQEGFDTHKDELDALVGKRGVTLSMLRPTGKVEIDGDRYDALTTGEFTDPGVTIVVAGIESNQLVVETASEDEYAPGADQA